MGGNVGAFEVGVALMPAAGGLRHERAENEDTAHAIEGFEETLGRARAPRPEHKALLIEKGEEAVQAATEAIARQISLAAQRIASVIEPGLTPQATSGSMHLESVQVSFGISLTAGVQAMFTSQVESSAQVTIMLSRKAGKPSETAE
jgi:hypothetical protein